MFDEPGYELGTRLRGIDLGQIGHYLSDSSGGWGVGSGQGTGGSIHLSGIGSENGISLGSGAGGVGGSGVGGSGVGEGLPGFCWFLILSIP